MALLTSTSMGSSENLLAMVLVAIFIQCLQYPIVATQNSQS